MRQAKVGATLIEYCVIFVLASLLMDELLVRVIGAPNNLFISMVAEFSGIAVSATVIGVLWGTNGNGAPTQ
jgi:Flp pilus assembly pilin Flp